MYKSNNVVLIGFKGSRKTIVARKLADALSFRFIDFDDYVEAIYLHDTGHKIKYKEIKQKQGEEYFLEIQRRGMRRIRNLDKTVLGTAGNTPFHPEVQRILGQMGHIVFLEDDPEKILSRMTAEGIPRFLDRSDVARSFRAYYKEWIDLYRTLADFIIPASGLTEDQIVAKVKSELSGLLY